MDFRIGLVIGASLWLVTEQQHPDNQICTSLTDIAKPCGCMLSSETFSPICGSDAQTYLSKCFLNCRMKLENIKITVAHEGGCKIRSGCSCTAEYEPVCGTDRVTYSNECAFNCFKKKDNRLRLEYYGECESSEIIDLYQDQEEPEYHNIQTRTSQGCPHQPQACPRTGPEKKLKNNRCLCAAIHRPVCSNHNTTYSNFCVVDCISKRNPSVEFQHWGVCGKPQKTP